MSSSRRLLCVCAIGLGAMLATSAAADAAAGTFYVNHATGNDLNPCTAPGAPCKTIQAAVEKAEAAPEDETAAIEVAAGVYTELVSLKPTAAGVTINGAGSGPGGTEIEGPESTGSSTVTIGAPGSAIGMSNLSIVNDKKADTGKGLVVAASLTLTNVVVTMADAVSTAGIEVSVDKGALTMHGGGVTMEAGTEGEALAGAPGSAINLEGVTILVASGSLAAGIETTFGAAVSLTKTFVNMLSAASERPGIGIDGGAATLTEDTVADNGAGSGSIGVEAVFSSPLAVHGLTITMTDAASKADAMILGLGTDDVDHLTVGGSWVGLGVLAEGGQITLEDSSIAEAAGSTLPALAYLGGSETPGLVLRRSVVRSTPSAIGSLFAANGNLTVDSSEVLGGVSAIKEEDAEGKTKTVTVAGSTIDAGTVGVADGPGTYGVAASAGKGNSIVNARIEGSIVLEQQLSLILPEGRSASVVCSNSDVPGQVQAVTATEGSIQCATGGEGNTHTEPAALFTAPITGYQLNPASSAVDSVPAGAIALPFGLTPSATDLAGNPRVVDGNGDCVAVQDRGALELQGHAAACPPPPPPPPPAPKPLAGVISGLTVSPSAFFAAPSGAAVTSARRKYGTKVGWRDSQLATTTFTVLRVSSGRRQGKSCRRPSKSNSHGKRCTLLLAQGSFTHTDVAGANSLHFSGRLKGRRLAPGAYRLQAVAHDAAGNGAAVTAGFTIK
jgi:hypothetical protein